MSTTAQVASVLMTLCIGMWAGGLLIVAVDRTHSWALMSLTDYAVDFRRSVHRLDPMMPILGLLGVVSAVVFALAQTGLAQILAWTGAGITLLAIVASIVLVEPINSRFRRLPEGTPPPQAEHDRVTWRRFHWIRTVAGIVAFAILATAIAVN